MKFAKPLSNLIIPTALLVAALWGGVARADGTYPGWTADGSYDNGEPTYVQDAATWPGNPYYGRVRLSFVQTHPLVVSGGVLGVVPSPEQQQPVQDHGCWSSYVASRTRNSVVAMKTGECW